MLVKPSLQLWQLQQRPQISPDVPGEAGMPLVENQCSSQGNLVVFLKRLQARVLVQQHLVLVKSFSLFLSTSAATA